MTAVKERHHSSNTCIKPQAKEDASQANNRAA